jgi:hypothetical protein
MLTVTPNQERRAVSAFVEKLRATYDVCQVIIFGARGRGATTGRIVTLTLRLC